MENNGKTFDSLSSQQPRAKLDRKRAWAQLAAEYLRDLPRQLDEIRAVLELKDYARIKKQAHRIKGTAGTYRFGAISEGAAELESATDSHDSDRIATVINKLVRLVELETGRLTSRPVSSAGNSERNTNG